MIRDVTFTQVAASLSLVALAAIVGLVLQLGVTRRIVVATIRAFVQLVAVGLLFVAIAGSDQSMLLAWLWVAVMIAVTAVVARRRAPGLTRGGPIAAGAVAMTVGLCLLVIFGLNVLPYESINVIVVAGITIGNSLPSQVLGANRMEAQLRDHRGQIEAMLALGLGRWPIVRQVGGQVVGTALIPQIERTNVVGLISLPGAMTGLLLAGADPLDAVLVQAVIMYLVLGAVAVSVIVTVVGGLWGQFTPDLRLMAVD